MDRSIYSSKCNQIKFHYNNMSNFINFLQYEILFILFFMFSRTIFLIIVLYFRVNFLIAYHPIAGNCTCTDFQVTQLITHIYVILMFDSIDLLYYFSSI